MRRSFTIISVALAAGAYNTGPASASLHHGLLGNDAGATYVNITAGTPVYGFVERGGEVFYRLEAPFLGGLSRCVAALSFSSGDCDLMATAGYYYDPVPGNAEWFARSSFGDAVIVIDANASFADVGAQCSGAPWSAGNVACQFNFGIVGTRGCNFTLSVGLGGRIELVPGVAVANALDLSGGPDAYSLVGSANS